MRSEHRGPLVASIIVVLACIGVMAHAVRTDALDGFARHTPMGMIAGSVLVPKPVPAPEPAVPAVKAPSTSPARPSAPRTSSAPGPRPVKHARSHAVLLPAAPKSTPDAPVAQVHQAVAATVPSAPAPPIAPPTLPTATKPTRPGHAHGAGHAHGSGHGVNPSVPTADADPGAGSDASSDDRPHQRP